MNLKQVKDILESMITAAQEAIEDRPLDGDSSWDIGYDEGYCAALVDVLDNLKEID